MIVGEEGGGGSFLGLLWQLGRGMALFTWDFSFPDGSGIGVHSEDGILHEGFFLRGRSVWS